MKVVLFNAGLGNQIFTYLFYRYLQRSYPTHRIYGGYWSGGLRQHEGLEVDKVFRVTLPPRTFFTDVLGKAYIALARLGLRRFLEDHEFAAWNVVFDFQWLDQRYHRGLSLKDELPFREELIDPDNKALAQKMGEGVTVAVHVRRGDYLTEENTRRYGAFCTKEYYERAIAWMRTSHPDARFYFFSDDIDYVRKAFAADDAVFVDTNKGSDSWKDMYLMAHCKHHIIANSTFSYWAARLAGTADGHIVIAPKKWYVWDDPDIFPDGWIRM